MKRFGLFVVGLALVGCSVESRATGPRNNSDADQGNGEVVELGNLKSAAPASWEKQKPTSNLRVYQFRIPKAGNDPKDAELTIFFFGEGSGGTVKANLDRWKSQFRAPEGKKIDDVTKVKEFKVGAVPVTYLDISGTYLEKFPPFAPNAKITPREDYRMLGVIFANEGGPYYLRLIGPARTVTQQKDAFDKWLKSFK
jgi:hypothetical protein